MKKSVALLFVSSTLIMSGLASPLAGTEPEHSRIEIEQPWSRPTPPGTPMGVGYLAIKNQSDREVILVGASTSRADHVSIHETLMQEGVMRMQPLKNGLTIPVGEVVELKPHSYHLMLEKLTEPLKEGESIPLTLTFEGAGAITVELRVRSLDAADTETMEMDHSGHAMGD